VVRRRLALLRHGSMSEADHSPLLLGQPRFKKPFPEFWNPPGRRDKVFLLNPSSVAMRFQLTFGAQCRQKGRTAGTSRRAVWANLQFGTFRPARQFPFQLLRGTLRSIKSFCDLEWLPFVMLLKCIEHRVPTAHSLLAHVSTFFDRHFPGTILAIGRRHESARGTAISAWGVLSARPAQSES
jgi:hypothetical protein